MVGHSPPIPSPTHGHRSPGSRNSPGSTGSAAGSRCGWPCGTRCGTRPCAIKGDSVPLPLGLGDTLHWDSPPSTSGLGAAPLQPPHCPFHSLGWDRPSMSPGDTLGWDSPPSVPHSLEHSLPPCSQCPWGHPGVGPSLQEPWGHPGVGLSPFSPSLHTPNILRSTLQCDMPLHPPAVPEGLWGAGGAPTSAAGRAGRGPAPRDRACWRTRRGVWCTIPSVAL